MTADGVAERMPPESEGDAAEPGRGLRPAGLDRPGRAGPARADTRGSSPALGLPAARSGRPIPRTADSTWARNPIDAFLAAAHQARGLKPAPPVGKDLWLRRVSLDLIGLPPTRQELHAFRDDDAPDAEEKVVDRLLASPRYGERWARHWMDVWRYSDWYGLGQEARYSHPHIWHWRDWIIASLNADKGYDRMVMEMLAGDELAPDDPDTRPRHRLPGAQLGHLQPQRLAGRVPSSTPPARSSA